MSTIGNRGFSIGINDVQPDSVLISEKERLIKTAYEDCEEYIKQYKLGKLQNQPGCTAEETLEVSGRVQIPLTNSFFLNYGLVIVFPGGRIWCPEQSPR
jgi:hypothetical protein